MIVPNELTAYTDVVVPDVVKWVVIGSAEL